MYEEYEGLLSKDPIGAFEKIALLQDHVSHQE